jgi:magnesium-transporting ATPase (P-type)
LEHKKLYEVMTGEKFREAVTATPKDATDKSTTTGEKRPVLMHSSDPEYPEAVRRMLLIAEHCKVLAGTDPADKELFVEMLRKVDPNQYTCATGDQTSDASALMASDVGITIA